MSTVFSFLALIVPVCAMAGSVVYSIRKHNEGQAVKKTLRANVAVFLMTIVFVSVCSFGAFATSDVPKTAEPEAPVTTAAVAQEAPEATEAAGSSKGLGLLAAGLVTGLAGIGGGIAVAAGAPAAIAATSEDPKAFGKSLIFVALGESIALYGVVISILILNKV